MALAPALSEPLTPSDFEVLRNFNPSRSFGPLDAATKEAARSIRRRLAGWMGVVHEVVSPHTSVPLQLFTSALNPNGREPMDYWGCLYPVRTLAENKSFAYQLAVIVNGKGLEVCFCRGSGQSQVHDADALARAQSQMIQAAANLREVIGKPVAQAVEGAVVGAGFQFRKSWRAWATEDFASLDDWLAHATASDGSGAAISRDVSAGDALSLGSDLAEQIARWLALFTPLIDAAYGPVEAVAQPEPALTTRSDDMTWPPTVENGPRRGARLFRETCLSTGNSFLWPTAHAWSESSLRDLREALTSNPIEGNELNFLQKIAVQLDGQPEGIRQVAADILFFYYLFPANVTPTTKVDRISTLATPESLAAMRSPSELIDLFGNGLGNAGIYYSTGLYWQYLFFLTFFQEIWSGNVEIADPASCQQVADHIVAEMSGKGVFSGRNILLHLLFPNLYAPIASRRHKALIVAKFRERAAGIADVDEALLAITRSLTAEYGHPINLYSPQFQPLWDPDYETPEPDGPVVLPGDHTPSAVGDLDSLAVDLNLPRGDVEELIGILIDKRQIIIEGPPGSGKTWTADKLARYLTDNPLTGDTDDRVEVVQFHQSYGYEDFVGGIRPKALGGSLIYEPVEGAFLQLCKKSASDHHRRVLIIDEVNRGNISRIFGELLYLLEYRQRSIRLQFDRRLFSVPANVLIIGTMNTTDRSLTQIDYALRRRFYFYRLSPTMNGESPVLASWLSRQDDLTSETRAQLLRLFTLLNTKITADLGEDFQVGHSYFMQQDVGTEPGLARIWRYGVLPLLDEYFHNRQDRRELLRGFDIKALLSDGRAQQVDDGASEDEEAPSE